MEQNKIVKIFNKKELEDVSRCRKYKKVYYLSDITHVDGEEVDLEILVQQEGVSRWNFPVEKPTHRMLKLW